MTAGPITITAECRLGDALNKATSPANDVHADRRPELYRRIAEQTAPQQTAPQQAAPQQTAPQQAGEATPHQTSSPG
jgi:hypothetical protein